MAKYALNINGKKIQLEAEPDTPMLWVIRDMVGLKGTKYGCGMALCGACTIHVNGQPVRSCSTTIDSIRKNDLITTIEGISENLDHI
ncbi:MAG: (2Fe-2S)-binding protein, partial [Bacteroidota bacterium]